MLVASIPAKFGFAWGYGASGTYLRAVPQITATPGAASLQFGYPPITFIPTGGGGIPPDGADENGILNQITLWLQWLAAGGPIGYDATFSSNVGGYPLGATLANASTAGLFWISTVDGNTTDPDTGGAGWTAYPLFQGAGTASQIWVGTNATAVVTAAALALASGQGLRTHPQSRGIGRSATTPACS